MNSADRARRWCLDRRLAILSCDRATDGRPVARSARGQQPVGKGERERDVVRGGRAGVVRGEAQRNARTRRGVFGRIERERGAFALEIGLRAHRSAAGSMENAGQFLRGDLRARRQRACRRAAGRRCARGTAASRWRWREACAPRSGACTRSNGAEQVALDFAAVHARRTGTYAVCSGIGRDHDDVVRARFARVMHAHGDRRFGCRARLGLPRLDRHAGERVLELRAGCGQPAARYSSRPAAARTLRRPPAVSTVEPFSMAPATL